MAIRFRTHQRLLQLRRVPRIVRRLQFKQNFIKVQLIKTESNKV